MTAFSGIIRFTSFDPNEAFVFYTQGMPGRGTAGTGLNLPGHLTAKSAGVEGPRRYCVFTGIHQKQRGGAALEAPPHLNWECGKHGAAAWWDMRPDRLWVRR